MRWLLIGIIVLVVVAGAILLSRARREGTVVNTIPFPTTSPTTTTIPTRIPTPVPQGTTAVTTLPATGVENNIILGIIVSLGAGLVLIKKRDFHRIHKLK